MEDYELTLIDRLQVIKLINERYDLENNSYLSFSGGKDSTILHYLLDEALPNNRIPRLYIDTGIEYNDVRQFVLEMASKDSRIIIVKPSQPIKATLEKYGYPFKSKQHSHNISVLQNNFKEISKVIEEIENNINLLKDYTYIHNLKNGTKSLTKYYFGVRERETSISFKDCPESLKYQFKEKLPFRCSDKCCYKLKKDPAHKWEKENNKSIAILGIRSGEGGMRSVHTGCVVLDSKDNSKIVKFKPLNPISKEWEEWYIEKNNIKICKLYYPPYNFERTGCKGCPYALDLQEQLTIMQTYLPNERKQCEMIWKPIYDEYRRIGYRLEKIEQTKLF